MTTWTTPKTWTAAALPVSDMNTYVRDNSNYLYERITPLYASADQSLATSSTVMQNVTNLVFAIGANEMWSIQGILLINAANATMDFKIGFTVPASTTMLWGNHSAAGTGSVAALDTASSRDAALTESSTQAFGSIAGSFIHVFYAVVFASSTAGNVQLQMAQNTSNASVLKVLKGSHLIIRQLG